MCFAAVFNVLTTLSSGVSTLLQRVLPAVKLHTKSTAQRGCGLGVGDLHHINMAVCRTEVAAVEV